MIDESNPYIVQLIVGTMRYLLLFRIRPERSSELGEEKRTIEFLESIAKFIHSNRKIGLMLIDGAFQDGTGAMSVVEVESDSELKQFVSDIPFRTIVDIESIPLNDSFEAIEKQKTLLGAR